MCAVTWVDFTELDVEELITQEIAAWRGAEPLEWKVYAHDAPSDLAERLASRGFVPDPPGTLMVSQLSRAPIASQAIDIRRVNDERGIDDFLAAASEAFDEDQAPMRAELEARLSGGTLALFVAYAGARPIGAARLELPPERAFAGAYTGSVVPDHRGRGIYRALLRARAKEAARRGYDYLVVEAWETSRPILERLGFEPLTAYRKWILPARA